MGDDEGRRRHYGDFYGLFSDRFNDQTSGRSSTAPAVDGSRRAPDTRPLWLVIGNCQAEALRLVLDGCGDRPFRTVRIPPVHEMTRADLPHLGTLLAQAALLACQPIRPDYRDLPVGTNQLAERLPRGARCIRWPVVRYAGLYPFQVIVRHPADRSAVPPVVPYHDLRTIAAARAGRGPDAGYDVDLSAAQVTAVAEASRAELARREQRDCDVAVSDVLAGHGADAAHTINHPGNPVIADLARRLLECAGETVAVRAPDETLLSSVQTPLEARVLDALGIDASPRQQWRHDGEQIDAVEVHRAQLHWYADHPDYLDLAVARHAATMDLLGLLEASTPA